MWLVKCNTNQGPHKFTFTLDAACMQGCFVTSAELNTAENYCRALQLLPLLLLLATLLRPLLPQHLLQVRFDELQLRTILSLLTYTTINTLQHDIKWSILHRQAYTKLCVAVALV